MIANTFSVASSHCVFQYFEQMYKMSRVPVVADTYGREAICSSIEPKKSRFFTNSSSKEFVETQIIYFVLCAKNTAAGGKIGLKNHRRLLKPLLPKNVSLC